MIIGAYLAFCLVSSTNNDTSVNWLGILFLIQVVVVSIFLASCFVSSASSPLSYLAQVCVVSVYLAFCVVSAASSL